MTSDLDLSQFTAVLFDFDGVIADTPKDNHRAWVAALAPYGIPFPELEFYRNEGAQTIEIAAVQLAKHGQSTDAAKQIAAAKDTFYQAQHSLSFYPKAIETVLLLSAAGFKTGLVTGAKSERVTTTVPNTVLAHFDTIVTGDDVARGKPDPEPYLLAARRLGKNPGKCLVVENAPLGVRSAKAAQMKCLALTTTLPMEELSNADYFLGNIAELYLQISRA
jgi:beta-phosphoglucomutase